jgi:glutamyl-Q tRNA(Asp) synthetase
LLDSTPKQIYLHQLLGFPTPHYAHVPVLIASNGQKLSKQTLAQAVNTQQPILLLFQLLTLLQQNPPIELKDSSIEEIMNWAITHWDLTQLKELSAFVV